MAISFFGFLSFTLFLISVPFTNSISFNFNFSDPNFDQFNNINLEGDALWNRTVMYLTRDSLYGDPTNSVGRASYKQPLLLWSDKSGEVTNFTTSFTFFIKTGLNTSYFPTANGDGIAFFLVPFPSRIPEKYVTGGCLALISLCETNSAPVVAVEFDTHKNNFDPSGDHVGIDVTKMTSIEYRNTSSMKRGDTTLSATVDYNGVTKVLSVSLSFDNDPSNVTTLSAFVDVKSVFNDSQVAIGFSAATGNDVEIHQILRWSFNSSFDSTLQTKDSHGQGSNVRLIVGLSIGIFFLLIAIGLVCCFFRRLYGGKTLDGRDETPMLLSGLELGPRRISYHELDNATLKFDETNKLGQGGFGSVYKGVLNLLGKPNNFVAIKKLSEDSKQGEDEFLSEVTIISKLAHKNLVELLGWCHEGKNLLLVYEFMPKGSLDNYLNKAEKTLGWAVRNKIAIDLADAILYLQEKYRQYVIHRDIKPSNIMLDDTFNAKLGDFGLARFGNHNQTLKMTGFAGTCGYIAPECRYGKYTTLTDVFSYGVVLIEMSCGKPPSFAPEGVKGGLVEWVWDLYGRDSLLDAVDPLLNGEYDVKEIERVMVVGLWCAHPDSGQRPSIREAIKVLDGENPLPSLPHKMPPPPL